jgi:hypothetical protein
MTYLDLARDGGLSELRHGGGRADREVVVSTMKGRQGFPARVDKVSAKRDLERSTRSRCDSPAVKYKVI